MTEPYVGEIRLFPWDWTVRGWALAAGQSLPVAQNQALFALIGTTYGGNGVTTFNLPDLRGRVAYGIGQSPGGSYYTWGQKAGAETVALTTATMPAHTHLLKATMANADKRPANGHIFAADTTPAVDFYAPPGTLVPLMPDSTSNTGGGQPHPNIQPYLALNYSIALQGLFPSRN